MKVHKSVLSKATVCVFVSLLLTPSLRGLSQETYAKSAEATTPAPARPTIPEGVSFAYPDIEAEVKEAFAAGTPVWVSLASGRIVPIEEAPQGEYGAYGLMQGGPRGGLLITRPKRTAEEIAEEQERLQRLEQEIQSQEAKALPRLTNNPLAISATERDRQACIANLVAIENAKDSWATANGKHTGDPVDCAGPAGLDRYLPGGFPCCPSGGTYTFCNVGTLAYCSIHGQGPATQANLRTMLRDAQQLIAQQVTAPAVLAVPVRHDCGYATVVDGDTLRVTCMGSLERVRLLRINTPEAGQLGFDESKVFLRSVLRGQTVALEFEQPGEIERDRYGRLLCYVFVANVNVNVEMVRAGWSPFWTNYGEGKYASAFRQAQAEARAKRAGVWRYVR